MTGKEPLDKFGSFVMRNLRDKGFKYFDLLAKAGWKAPALQKLQQDLMQFTPEQREVVRRAVRRTMDVAIHDFLFALQEYHDAQELIEVLVDGTEVAALSDGMHGELFGDDGWEARFSTYGKAPEEA